MGVGSIYALNRALLFKWIWRFRVNYDDLWIKVIKNIYGINGGIGEMSSPSYASRHASSLWIAILKVTKQLAEKGVDLLSMCKRKVGDGSSISFWDDDKDHSSNKTHRNKNKKYGISSPIIRKEFATKTDIELIPKHKARLVYL